MLDITFKYKDSLSNYEWRKQHCIVDTIEECIKIYGLNTCEYKIIEVYCDKECEYNNRFINNQNKIWNCINCCRYTLCEKIHQN